MSCAVNGYCAAEVLAEPVAPVIRMPVYMPFSGSTSQPGCSEREPSWWWVSPITSRVLGHEGRPAAGCAQPGREPLGGGESQAGAEAGHPLTAAHESPSAWHPSTGEEAP